MQNATQNLRYIENELTRYFEAKVQAKYDTNKFPPCSGMIASYEFWIKDVDGRNIVEVRLYLYRDNDYIFSFFNGCDGEEHKGNLDREVHSIQLLISWALSEFEKQYC